MNINQLETWLPHLKSEIEQPYFILLQKFINQERKKYQIFPPEDEVFTAFQLTPFPEVKVVILGQDPYHNVNQAHGLSFSVKKGAKIPPSLDNIFKELNQDQKLPMPTHGDLSNWAKQGVLMLNTVLTVRIHEANSHKDKGWEMFTNAVISLLNRNSNPIIFVLWGQFAQRKIELINTEKHFIIKSPHPSPFSANKGFFGSKPFSQINLALQKSSQSPINWEL